MIQHINVKVSSAIAHVKSHKVNMFSLPKHEALANLEKLKAEGIVFLSTEGCKSYNPKTGCECGKDQPKLL